MKRAECERLVRSQYHLSNGPGLVLTTSLLETLHGHYTNISLFGDPARREQVVGFIDAHHSNTENMVLTSLPGTLDLNTPIQIQARHITLMSFPQVPKELVSQVEQYIRKRFSERLDPVDAHGISRHVHPFED